MTTPYPDHPQLRGNYAPIRMECDIDDVIVRGELPKDLDITYYRNGPDPQFPPRRDHHWFAGDGMLHMFHVGNGRLRYRNRWVRTGKWKAERREGRSLVNPFNPLQNDHPMNAYTEGNRIVAHVMQFDEVPLFPNVDGTPTAPPQARLTEWVIDLAANANGVQRRRLDDTTGEFPRLDERFAGTATTRLRPTAARI